MNERLPKELFTPPSDAVTASPWPSRFLPQAGVAERATAQAWLTRLAAMLPLIGRAAVLVEGERGDTLLRLAAWPPSEEAGFEVLEPAVAAILQIKQAAILRLPGEDGQRAIGLPIVIDGQVVGVFAATVAAGDEIAARAAMDKAELALGWLAGLLVESRQKHDEVSWARSVFALDLLAAISDETKPDRAALVLANETVKELGADRVSIGYAQNGRIRLAAISSTAWFKRKSPSVAAAENAMEEALDQLSTVVHPARAGETRTVEAAHAAYARMSGAGAVLSVILARGGKPVGVLMAERREARAFAPREVELAEAVADLAGPYLHLNRKQWRWLSGRGPDLLRRALAAVFGPRHPSLKLGLVLALAFIAFAALYPAQFRVSADAVLEGSEQRAATMPFAGFVAEAAKRAGDTVRQGDLLVQLDDKDLRLENLRWVAEYSQLQQQKRKALVGEERAEIGILDAQIEQARAQIALSAAMLERARITAPIDGVVISGDWSQKLGTPVEKGTVLMEIAPLTDYRVILKADERDVQFVSEGQRGMLLLAGRTDAAYPVEVARITSVASAEEGRNLFRVEARPLDTLPELRPGMEGVAKIDIEERSLFWIWSRGVVTWARQFIWRWTP